MLLHEGSENEWFVVKDKSPGRSLVICHPFLQFLTVKILLYTVTVLVLLVILQLIQWNAWWQTIHVTNHPCFKTAFLWTILSPSHSTHGKSIHGECVLGFCCCCCCCCWLCRCFTSFFNLFSHEIINMYNIPICPPHGYSFSFLSLFLCV